MIKIKESIKIFLRSAVITAVVLSCIAAVFLGIAKSYEAIQKISFGREQKAVEVTDEGIRILDFKIKIMDQTD